MPFPIISGAVAGVVAVVGGGIVVTGVIIENHSDYSDHSDHSDYGDAARREAEQRQREKKAAAERQRIEEMKERAVAELRDMALMGDVEIPDNVDADDMPEAIAQAVAKRFDREIDEKKRELDQLNTLQQRIAEFRLTKREKEK
jgi:hypothetical protein